MKRFTHFTLTVVFSLFGSYSAKACSCATWTDNFCSSLDATDGVVLIEVFDSFHIPGPTQFSDVNLLQVRVLENISGTMPFDTFFLASDDGFTCHRPVGQYNNDTLVYRYYANPTMDTLSLSVCEVSVIELQGDHVVGAIYENISSQLYSTFKNDI